MMSDWYLVHTKAQSSVASMGALKSGIDALLPLLKKPVHRWDKVVSSVGPLFPCYLFVFLEDLQIAAPSSSCRVRVVWFGSAGRRRPSLRR